VEAAPTTDQPHGRDELRSRMRGMWAAVAPAWEEHAGYADARGAQVTETMLRLAELHAGDRVLELACGPGGAGIAAAGHVVPGGEVVLSDVAPEMTAVAVRRAAAAGVVNVSARVLDLDEIREPDASYDVVLCREGLMFATDPAAALREIRRVLRPGGRVALAVWGPRARNPWLGLVLDAVSAQTGRPAPPPGVPGPFSLDDADRLRSLLDGAGLADARVDELAVPLQAGSFDEWWQRTSVLAGPLSTILGSLPDHARRELRHRLRETVAPYRAGDGLEFPGVTLVAAARRR
jgi:ubiquinone/menaquinone biosynthesis C-methylase UbiE